MDWVQIGLIAIAVIWVFFGYYNYKKASRLMSPSELNKRIQGVQHVREIETLEARKPARPWADDPIAKAIEWDERAEGGGGVDHKLRHVGSSRVEFQPAHPRSWYIITLLMAAGATALVCFEGGSIGQIFSALLGGIGFSAFGWLLFHFSLTPVVFDKSSGNFWKGRKKPEQVSGNPPSKCIGRIDDIYALQLILTYLIMESPDSAKDSHTYPQYQINLVMKNGTRINVVNYSNSSDSPVKNARALSMFLGKPLWDAR
jgi:hypothetical protein